MKIVTIIQARMGASRLPGKMLMDIGGKPAIAWSVERASLSRTIDEIWIATTTEKGDDALADWALHRGVSVYRGSEHDVLDRYYKTAKQASADVVVRITADCPLIDPDVVDTVVRAYQEGKCDYASNVHPPTYPDGLDVEVFSFSALERAHHEAALPSEREHVTPYLWKHSELFTIKNITHSVDLSRHRWTLDTKEDLEFLHLVTTACQERGEHCGIKEVLQIVEEHPEWEKINARHGRNEGYIQSVQSDTHVGTI